jgi:hypothetical protein
MQERNRCYVSIERKVAKRTLLKCFAVPMMPVLFVIEEVMGNTVDTADFFYHFQLKYDDSPFLGLSEELRKANINFIVSVLPSASNIPAPT